MQVIVVVNIVDVNIEVADTEMVGTIVDDSTIVPP